MRGFAVALCLNAVALPALAFEMPQDEDAAQFVTSNVIATFYHELGHGLIDILGLPVLGKEEDAADSLSAVLVHRIWDEDAARQITYDTAAAYWLTDAEASVDGAEPAYADEHSLDLQRYYTVVCLYYGADPDNRADVAKDLELPPERAERCPDEYAQADSSWGAMLTDLEPQEGSFGLELVDTDPDDPIAQILASEIADLNKVYGLPEKIEVRIAPCGEANAFYFPDDKSITICTEYAEDLVRMWEASPS